MFKQPLGAALKPSIARRLIASLLLACALVWAGIYVQGMYFMRASGSGNFDTEMLAWSETVTRVVEANAGGTDIALALTGLNTIIEVAVASGDTPRGFQAFQVHSALGQVVARGGDGPDVIAPGAEAPGYFDIDVKGERFRVLRRWSSDKQYRIDITQSEISRQQIFDQVMISREGLLSPILVGFPLVLLPVWLAVHTGLTPLRRLSRELAARKSADLTPLNVPHVYRELAPLVDELNATMARLQGLLQRERDFLADAAHELRTPLALISAQCDTLLHTQTPKLREEAAQRLHSGVARSSHLVNQLLSLARLDADAEDELMATDLADAVRECLAAHAPEASDRHIELSYVGPNSLMTRCPGQAIASILDNLVRNAIRYGRPGGQVEVRIAQPERGKLRLLVADDGLGIAPEERLRMFERFRRGNHPSVSGSGLGLAIVASAARQLAATIDVLDGLHGKGVGIVVSWDEPLKSSSGPGPWRCSQ
jgi:two-component system, OmpR family, sensor histidine kinase QseC